MSKTFGIAERNLNKLFVTGAKFTYEGILYTVDFAGKPTCSDGEPKTDIYVHATSDHKTPKEFKISFKKKNANFLENKTNEERAKNLLGDDWPVIISTATKTLEKEFSQKPLIFKDSYGHTKAGSITLGWKFEILNILSGQLSGEIELTHEQIIDIYAGTSLPANKRNAMVNGRVIENSGIANFIIFEEDSIGTIQAAVDQMQTIEEYVEKHPKVYFACKALNYRSLERKYDGNRPLAVYVKWSVVDDRLKSEICFDSPLTTKGNDVYNSLISALNQLGMSDTNDISSSNLLSHQIMHG